MQNETRVDDKPKKNIAGHLNHNAKINLTNDRKINFLQQHQTEWFYKTHGLDALRWTKKIYIQWEEKKPFLSKIFCFKKY